jgi:hypothetical protein
MPGLYDLFAGWLPQRRRRPARPRRQRVLQFHSGPQIDGMRHPARFARVLLLALLLVSASPAQTSRDFRRGKAAWREHRYVAAVGYLLAARAQPNGRTAELDYMLGTSGCRLSARRAWGLKYLNWTRARHRSVPPAR